MNTVKLDKRGSAVRMIGHQGIHTLETGNTASGFVAAGNRSYWVIETDVHLTADGQFVIIHDDNTLELSGSDHTVEETDSATLLALQLYDRDGGGHTRRDLVIPTLREYIRICRKYEKYAVLELKNPMPAEAIPRLVAEIADEGWLEHTVFISFAHQNLVELRRLLPDAKLMYLTIEEIDEALLAKLVPWRLDLDVRYFSLTKEGIALVHAAGLEVNCWNLDDPEAAATYLDWGLDYITTNIME